MADETKLDRFVNRLKKSREKLPDGFILPGTIVRRYTICGTMGCSCRKNRKMRHGPYYDWTRKVHGKTVSVRLTEEQARILQEWIKNKVRFYDIVSEIERITLDAAEIIRD
jgi:hypothetical protein